MIPLVMNHSSKRNLHFVVTVFSPMYFSTSFNLHILSNYSRFFPSIFFLFINWNHSKKTHHQIDLYQKLHYTQISTVWWFIVTRMIHYGDGNERPLFVLSHNVCTTWYPHVFAHVSILMSMKYIVRDTWTLNEQIIKPRLNFYLGQIISRLSMDTIYSWRLERFNKLLHCVKLYSK